MSKPHSQQTRAVSAALTGAVDLSALKARADSARRARPAGSPPAPGGTPTSGQWVVDVVVDVTDQSFNTEVVDRSMQVPVVVDLWATWCGPCRQLSPVLERLAEAGSGAWVLAKVDVDTNPGIAQAFGVQSIPMVVAVAGGQALDAFYGALPESQVRQWITSMLDQLRPQMPGIAAAEQAVAAAGPRPTAGPAGQPGGADSGFSAAEAAVQAGDYAAAEAAYQQILDSEPANAQAKAALAQVRFLARTRSTDLSAVAVADATPDDVGAQLAAADAEVAHQRVAQGFERLVGAVRRLSGGDRERVRVHLVELFDLFPPDDPRVAAARRALARALF